jgi:hypothetical protein
LKGTTTVSDGPLGVVVGVVAGTRIVCGVVRGDVCGTTGRGKVAGGVVRGVVRGVVTGTVVAGAVTGGAVVAGACVVRVCFGATVAATFGNVVVDGRSDGTTAVVRGTRDDETAWTASYVAPTAITQNTSTSTRLMTPWTVSGSSRG